MSAILDYGCPPGTLCTCVTDPDPTATTLRIELGLPFVRVIAKILDTNDNLTFTHPLVCDGEGVVVINKADWPADRFNEAEGPFQISFFEENGDDDVYLGFYIDATLTNCITDVEWPFAQPGTGDLADYPVAGLGIPNGEWRPNGDETQKPELVYMHGRPALPIAGKTVATELLLSRNGATGALTVDEYQFDSNYFDAVELVAQGTAATTNRYNLRTTVSATADLTKRSDVLITFKVGLQGNTQIFPFTLKA